MVIESFPRADGLLYGKCKSCRKLKTYPPNYDELQEASNKRRMPNANKGRRMHNIVVSQAATKAYQTTKTW